MSAHGLMHTLIANAHAGDPYKIDTLFMYMANMAWNSSMNPGEAARMMADKDPDGGYRIPHIIYSDAFYSETVAYADLVLPDTTYLERWDCISLLDRPIGSPEGPADSIRQPVLPPDRDVRPFQDVLIDLGARLKLPGFVKEDGSALYRDYAGLHRQPRTPPRRRATRGVSRRRRQRRGRRRAQPRPVAALRRQRLLLAVPPRARGAVLQARQRRVPGRRQAAGPDRQHRADRAAALREPVQKFRLAAEGHGPVQPPDAQRERMRHYFDPLPIWYPPFEQALPEQAAYPLHAVTQRPMAMYHAWHSQNAWLRQIYSHNRLYMHRGTAAALGIGDDGWVWVIGRNGRLKCQVRLMEGVNPDTVWTWNAIGKRRGAWNLADNAPESERGFLLNHVISEFLAGGRRAQRRPGHRPGRVVRSARAGGKSRRPGRDGAAPGGAASSARHAGRPAHAALRRPNAGGGVREMGVMQEKTSPAGAGEVEMRSIEGEGDRAGTLHSFATGRPDHPHPPLRGDPSARPRKRERL